jgi:hypothetical protein
MVAAVHPDSNGLPGKMGYRIHTPIAMLQKKQELDISVPPPTSKVQGRREGRGSERSPSIGSIIGTFGQGWIPRMVMLLVLVALMVTTWIKLGVRGAVAVLGEMRPTQHFFGTKRGENTRIFSNTPAIS